MLYGVCAVIVSRSTPVRVRSYICNNNKKQKQDTKKKQSKTQEKQQERNQQDPT